MTIRKYPYGFLLAKRSVAETIHERLARFEKVELRQDYVLLRSTELTFSRSSSVHSTVVVLGEIYATEDPWPWTESSAERLLKLYESSEADFHRFLETAGGRYSIFIIGDSIRVYNDALALFPVYVDANGDAFSSHLYLLQEASTPHELLRESNQYYEGFETELDGCRALVPNFYFDGNNNSFQRFFPRQRNPYLDVPDDEKIDEAIRLIRNSVNQVNRLGKTIACALTAGHDSRLSAAALLSEGTTPVFVTYGTRQAVLNQTNSTLDSYSTDVTTASQIASDLGLNHRVLTLEDARSNPLSSGDSEILNLNGPLRHGRSFQSLYEAEFGDRETIMVVGTGFESWIDYYSTASSAVDSRSDWDNVLRTVASKTQVPSEEQTDWLADAWNTGEFDIVEQSGYPSSNFIYWEIRSGRFQSEAINCQSTSFLPMNPVAIRRVIQIGLSFDFWTRKSRGFHRRLINGLFPALLSYPFNGKQSLIESLEGNLASREFVLESPKTSVAVPLQVYEDSRYQDHKPLEFTVPNTLALTKNTLAANSRVYFEFFFPLPQGDTEINLSNSYCLNRAVEVADIFVAVEGEDLFNQDLGWDSENLTIRISGLQRGARVEVGVKSRLDIGKSWISPSQLLIKDLQFIRRSLIEPIAVFTTSQYGRINTQNEE